MKKPTARLLDLSRLVSRAGRGRHTGIDRVEAAYLSALLADDIPLFALVRSPIGLTLYDRRGVEALADRLVGGADWGRPHPLAYLFRRVSPIRRRVLSDIYRLCVARCRSGRGLGRMIGKSIAPGFVWVAVGHSNLRRETFDGVRASGGRSAVMIHDTIPLDRPEVQTDTAAARFSDRITLVSRHADLVIHTADATRATTEHWLAKAGRVPPGLTAHLGIVPPPVVQGDVPPDLRDLGTFFLFLGTLEPRKNLPLLLDTWAELSRRLPEVEVPKLVLVGALGWLSDDDRARIAQGQAHVITAGQISDGAVGALLSQARALLMPSLIEGFGLPPGEALALGCPVVLSDLAVFREVFGNNPVYLDPTDLYLWAAEIQAIAQEKNRRKLTDVALPTWKDHFKTVLKVL
ncbi:glycosyltransferase family 1 protein [uncultured Maritimibacter sp.]|uniref:glycosyltransferase family 4 protein n=1 Tax=uncultured Maritimibacter sp. TaxID=991866 RepID=UPI002618A27C|nr:glycosyltransferase family 1 protein [uncultured Maritimibacter sp.]